MARITLDDDRTGYEDFPDGFRIVGRDDGGDPLAVGTDGKVRLFEHGSGSWAARSVAFASIEQLHAVVAFQANFAAPEPEERLEALLARKQRIQRFAKEQGRTPYLRWILPNVLDDLRQAIADRRFSASRRGRALAARQELCVHCEEALRAAGVPGDWMVRPHVDRDRVIVAMGHFDAKWTEAKITDVLQPLLGRYELSCRERPKPAAGA